MSFEIAFSFFLAFLFLCYLGVHLYALKGLGALHRRQERVSDEKPQISVIVAARNEETNIGRCLRSLVQQEYPKASFEIIVVDDRSTDGTAAIIRNYRTRYPFVNLVSVTQLSSELPPKKNALNEGIRRSKYDILAFTDADCTPPAGWLACMAKEFLPDVGLVAGYCPHEQQFPSRISARWGYFFLRYLEVKNSFGAVAGIGLDRAFMCKGGNLAYRKSVFVEVGGYEKIKKCISGDDDLFMQLVQHDTKWKIRYMVSPQSYVLTAPPDSLGAFINQRKRHLSAGKYYPLHMKVLFTVIHSFGALAFLSLIVFPALGIGAVTAKLVVDGWILSKGTSLFGDTRLLRSLVPLEIASVLYNSFIGPLGVLGTFTWKGNKT